MEILEYKSRQTRKQISLRQIRILRNLGDFRAHSRQLRSSYKRGLTVDQLSKIIAGKV